MMERRNQLGISVYFQDMDLVYLQEAAACGVSYVFTSLHIPEEQEASIKEHLPILINACQSLGLCLVPDISPTSFQLLNIEKDTAIHDLKALGLHALRLDYGFYDLALVQQYLREFTLFMNASTIDEAYLQRAKEAGVSLNQMIMTHNFYPKKYTGLTIEDVAKRNALLHSYGLRVQAFVCGDAVKRFPLYEGLPTVEAHRCANPFVAAVELIRRGDVDDIMIGDSRAKSETLRMIDIYRKEGVLTIKAKLEPEYEELYDHIYSIRKDGNQDMIRIQAPRKANVSIGHNTVRTKGCITMDNYLYGRYSGEVQLIRHDLEQDARVNVIGYIHPEFIDLLALMDGESSIRFVRW